MSTIYHCVEDIKLRFQIHIFFKPVMFLKVYLVFHLMNEEAEGIRVKGLTQSYTDSWWQRRNYCPGILTSDLLHPTPLPQSADPFNRHMLDVVGVL